MHFLNLEIHVDSNIYASSSPLQDGISCDGEIKEIRSNNFNSLEDENILLIEKLLTKFEKYKSNTKFKKLMSELNQQLDKQLNTNKQIELSTMYHHIEATTIFTEDFTNIDEESTPTMITEHDKRNESASTEESATIFKFAVQNIVLLLIFILALILIVFKIIKPCFSNPRRQNSENNYF